LVIAKPLFPVKGKYFLFYKSAGSDTTETRWYISSLDLDTEQALNALAVPQSIHLAVY